MTRCLREIADYQFAKQKALAHGASQADIQAVSDAHTAVLDAIEAVDRAIHEHVTVYAAA